MHVSLIVTLALAGFAIAAPKDDKKKDGKPAPDANKPHRIIVDPMSPACRGKHDHHYVAACCSSQHFLGVHACQGAHGVKTVQEHIHTCSSGTKAKCCRGGLGDLFPLYFGCKDGYSSDRKKDEKGFNGDVDRKPPNTDKKFKEGQQREAAAASAAATATATAGSGNRERSPPMAPPPPPPPPHVAPPAPPPPHTAV